MTPEDSIAKEDVSGLVEEILQATTDSCELQITILFYFLKAISSDPECVAFEQDPMSGEIISRMWLELLERDLISISSSGFAVQARIKDFPEETQCLNPNVFGHWVYFKKEEQALLWQQMCEDDEDYKIYEKIKVVLVSSDIC